MQLNWTNAKEVVWRFYFLVFEFLAFRIEGQAGYSVLFWGEHLALVGRAFSSCWGR